LYKTRKKACWKKFKERVNFAVSVFYRDRTSCFLREYANSDFRSASILPSDYPQNTILIDKNLEKTRDYRPGSTEYLKIMPCFNKGIELAG